MTLRILLLIALSQHCFCQDYNTILSKRVDEIKALHDYENTIVVFGDTSRFGWDVWESKRLFYLDEMVKLHGKSYMALTDNQGMNPTTSPLQWKITDSGHHPYQFLRDTAKTEDLEKLLRANHPYVRTYAFAALAHRKHKNLFQIVFDNLSDTTHILEFTKDSGEFLCPADIMLSYCIDNFTNKQKDLLKSLIITKYNHLISLEEVLIFHKPVPEEYQDVRAIAERGFAEKFALIALSGYRKMEDLELILKGFNHDDYYRGHKVFFKAIENFPHESFREKLIDYHNGMSMKYDLSGCEYYFNALAAFKDKSCLEILDGLVHEEIEIKSDHSFHADLKMKNLQIIYQALKKYYTPIYDKLIMQIKVEVKDKIELEHYKNSLESSPWNY